MPREQKCCPAACLEFMHPEAEFLATEVMSM